MRIQGQRARNDSGSPAGDRFLRWGALIIGVSTRRFMRMRYVVIGWHAGTDRSWTEQRARRFLRPDLEISDALA
jgi:hypothetical protein